MSILVWAKKRAPIAIFPAIAYNRGRNAAAIFQIGKGRVIEMASDTLYTVVVADDEYELREAVCTMIPWQELGYRLVGSAGNGLDALQLVEELRPDLLLTDIRMPFISGIELARQVREVRPATQIAFLSGYDEFEYAQQAIQYDIISYMLKPLTVKGLGEELQVIRQKLDAQFAMFRQAASQDRKSVV